MTDCLFCKIIEGEIDSTIIYSDDDVVAIEDINPQAPRPSSRLTSKTHSHDYGY